MAELRPEVKISAQKDVDLPEVPPTHLVAETDLAKSAEDSTPPLHRDDKVLSGERLQARRCKWLELHVQQTAHITSQVPLVKGLPVRLTDSVDRSRSLFRNRRGTIVDCAEHGEKQRIDVDGDSQLSTQLKSIYFHFEECT